MNTTKLIFSIEGVVVSKRKLNKTNVAIMVGFCVFLAIGCNGTSSSTEEANNQENSDIENDSGQEVGNQPPVANAGVDQSVSTGSIVNLDASKSTDADGDALGYQWDLLQSPSGSQASLDSHYSVTTSFTADMAGTYLLQVTASDNEGGSSDQVTVTATQSSGSTNNSTSGVYCDYTNNTLNDSASVNEYSTASWACGDSQRTLSANGIPDHQTGTFPNSGNPNTITVQTVSVSFPIEPVKTTVSTELGGPRGPEGYILNGVKVDASTAESCADNEDDCDLMSSGSWNVEALSQNHFNLGFDENNAHVQPTGAYHYHGLPEGFIELRGGNSSTITLIGWASDGFPIYARYGYSDPTDANSQIKNMTGSYQLVTEVSSSRPSVDVYDLGTFAQDWVYVEGAGDLDACNGRYGVTPEFPNGIYHYYATDTYPFFQRCVMGEVSTVSSRPSSS